MYVDVAAGRKGVTAQSGSMLRFTLMSTLRANIGPRATVVLVLAC
jgi:hypothetical protein